MLTLLRFARYARAFEKTLGDDDWSRVRPFFHREVVYEVADERWGCRLVGVDAVLAGLKKSLDGFDRKFSRRSARLRGVPRLGWNRLRIGWSVRYAHDELEPFVLVGSSEVRYRGGLIAHLGDRFVHAESTDVDAWIAANGVELDPGYT